MTLAAYFFGRAMGWPAGIPGGANRDFSTALLLTSITLYNPWSRKTSGSSFLTHGSVSYVVTIGVAVVVGYVGQGQLPSLQDGITVGCLFAGLQQRPTPSEEPQTSALMRTIRAYLNSILTNAESRKIFYFLVLNMCYMLIQMLYGIWTNSLGLISDAIHMAFDCMAIGVGLVASVMARWPPNERYTYGYSRIETLSGFSNGIFLILISVFIVFEAIQRILSPPEMNTNQLLLVSSVGLAVNLFGMFAMGGHAHHGHSHSHGHSHDDHDDDTHAHSHSQDHGHSHAQHSHSPDTPDYPSAPHISVSESDEPRVPDVFKFDSTDMPLTPSYHFEHDDHLEHFHGHQPHLSEHIQEGHSHNMRGVFLHVMADTLGSVGVIISTLLIQFYGWTGFDPIASLFIAILIAASVVPLIADTGKVLLLEVGAERSIKQSVKEIEHIPGVRLQSSMFWPKNDSNTVGSIHVEISEGADHKLFQLTDQVEHCFRDNMTGLDELTVQASLQ